MTFIKIGQKIKYVREKKLLTQESLGRLTGYDKSTISKFENGARLPDSYALTIIKSKLGIPFVPLTAEEINQYKEKLYFWFHQLKRSSDSMQEELKWGFELTVSKEMSILYLLFSLRLYHNRGNIEEAEKIISILESEKSHFNDFHYYYYYYSLGVYYDDLNKIKQAISCFLKAEKIDVALRLYEDALYYYLAKLFTAIGYAPKAILYLIKAREISRMNYDKTFEIYYDIIEANNYNKIGESERAMKILLNCLYQTDNSNESFSKGIIYHNLGCVCANQKYYDKALEYFNMGFDYIRPDSNYYIENLFNKAYLLLEYNQPEASACIKEGLEITTGKDEYLYLFKSLECLETGFEKIEMLDFIEEISIPRLLKNGQYFLAIKFCNIVAEYYSFKKKYKKAFEYKDKAAECYEMILNGKLDL